MYGLPQAVLLVNTSLECHLNAHGYKQMKNEHGLWQHKTWQITFTLVVHDFGAKYIRKKHSEHSMSILKQHYKTLADLTGSKYIGLTPDWDYKWRKVHLSMPSYVSKALEYFQCSQPAKQHDTLHPFRPPKHWAKIQIIEECINPLHSLKKYKDMSRQWQAHYFNAVNLLIPHSLQNLAQYNCNPADSIYGSNMRESKAIFRILKISRVKGHDFIWTQWCRTFKWTQCKKQGSKKFPKNNGYILNIDQINKAVIASAIDTKLGHMHEKLYTSNISWRRWTSPIMHFNSIQ